jgi:hypothetical protein
MCFQRWCVLSSQQAEQKRSIFNVSKGEFRDFERVKIEKESKEIDRYSILLIRSVGGVDWMSIRYFGKNNK